MWQFSHISSDKQTIKVNEFFFVSTSTTPFLQEVLNDLSLRVVAGDLCHHGTELAELAQQAVLVVGVTQLSGEGTALACFQCRRPWTGRGTSLGSYLGQKSKHTIMHIFF